MWRLSGGTHKEIQEKVDMCKNDNRSKYGVHECACQGLLKLSQRLLLGIAR